MARPFFWHRFSESPVPGDSTIVPRRRLRLCLLAFLALVGVVFGRVVQLEVSQGAAFREEAAKPLVREESLAGARGRILARNGTVLACDKPTLALAVHYRYLEEPADPQWLRGTARARLSREDRRRPDRVSAEVARVAAERADLARRLAALCGLSSDEWRRRAAAVQVRVERISATVNRRRRQRWQCQAQLEADGRSVAGSTSWLGRVGDSVREFLEASMEEPPPDRVVVAEELAHHVMAEDIPLDVAAELEGHADAYPSVKIVQQRRRVYPAGSLAAHVLGYLGAVQPDELRAASGHHPEDRVGRVGLERRYEDLLYGRRGVGVELVDRSGRIVASRLERAPGVGRDLVLTLDPQLQRTAEDLLGDALRRRALKTDLAGPAGGAAVVMNVHSGAVLAAASAPGFDPNLFSGGGDQQLGAILDDPAHPLVDRVTSMAIAPGSVFKVITTIALLETAAVAPEEPFRCQGYLSRPDSWRCAVYRRHGIGHGELTLAEALVHSCNVYFLHHAGRIGPEPLIDWAARFGLGQPTGIDLPEQSAGVLPTPGSIESLEGHPWRRADTLALSIGQGSLQVTPLQVARLMAAAANGGLLVTPHLVSGLALPTLGGAEATAGLDRSDDAVRIPLPEPIAELRSSTLVQLREALGRVVADPEGTAHGGLWMESLEVAGKTGTAETDGPAGDHAWFAGYAPADRPRIVFVVALEHAGNAEETAVPVAKRLVLRLQQLGYFDRR